MNLPFARSYWVEPGRLLAGCYPGDQHQEIAARKLQGLLQCGVSRVVSLMEAREVGHGGHAFADYEAPLRALAQNLGRPVECRRFPIADCSVPSAAGMAEILDYLAPAHFEGEVTYLHCWGGRGRTSTVVACHLRRARGLAAPAALSRLAELTAHQAAAFRSKPETPAQRDFIHAWKEVA
jgi:hypothetical protein